MKNLFTHKKIYTICFVMLLSLVSALAISTSVYASTFYISPTGDDNNQGTETEPFKTIIKAQDVASYGDIVYIRGGVYDDFTITNTDSNYSYVHDITKSGITYEAYADEKPVFDFKAVPTNLRVCAFRVADKVTDVTFKGFEVTGVKVGSQKQSECFRVIGQATFINMVCHDNEAIGFYFTTRGSGACTNCDAYNNIGPTSASIGNIDGFGAHANSVTFSYCRSWHNSDDGYDCINASEPMTFDHCWAYDMTAGGDSNGFKIGGWGNTEPDKIANPLPVHTVKYCIAAKNNAHGFYSNHQPGQSANWTYNTSFYNKMGNFDMLERISPSEKVDIPGTREVLHYNISYGGTLIKDDNNPSENVTDNSWTMDSLTLSDVDFQSIDAAQLTLPRKSDGSMPDITFMRPISGSSLSALGCFADNEQ